MGAQLRAVLPPSKRRAVRLRADVVASDTCASYPGDAIPDERDGSRAVVLFNYVLHHAGDGSTISLLQEARRVSRRWVVVVEDLRGETLEEAELNFAHEWGGVFRGPREWAQLFRLVGLELRETIPIPRDCGFRDLARAVFVLEVRCLAALCRCFSALALISRGRRSRPRAPPRPGAAARRAARTGRRTPRERHAARRRRACPRS